MSRKLFWQKTQQEIDAKIATLKSRDAGHLRHLIAAEDNTPFRDGRFVATITTWGREVDSNKLAIVVEARMSRFGGLWHNVIAHGFFVLPNGITEPLQEKDLWNLGY
jgi:hypothetical protein